jgi:hypothetical protein
MPLKDFFRPPVCLALSSLSATTFAFCRFQFQSDNPALRSPASLRRAKQSWQLATDNWQLASEVLT